jgi:concanavalin A-like lectin/glucanase superfamily protein/flagellar hook capping protein FlgD
MIRIGVFLRLTLQKGWRDAACSDPNGRDLMRSNPRRLAPLLVAVTLLAAPRTTRADLTTGLIAHYPFDGSAVDVSGNGNHGGLVNGPVATTDRFGRASHAYEFNGTNSYVLVPSSASLASPTNRITMSAWVQLYGNSKVGSPFSPILMKSVEGGNAFMYRFHMSTTYFGCAYTDWNLSQATGANLTNQWAHIAITYDGAKNRYYLNGAPKDSTTLAVTMTADSRPLTIGADFPGLFEVFWGKIDEVRIYNRTLAPAEVQALATELLDVGDAPATAALAVAHAVPNPTMGPCTFAVTLAEPTDLEVSIVDIAGRIVRSLSPGRLPAGARQIAWDGLTNAGAVAPPGLYLAEFRAGRARIVSRVLRVD